MLPSGYIPLSHCLNKLFSCSKFENVFVVVIDVDVEGVVVVVVAKLFKGDVVIIVCCGGGCKRKVFGRTTSDDDCCCEAIEVFDSFSSIGAIDVGQGWSFEDTWRGAPKRGTKEVLGFGIGA